METRKIAELANILRQNQLTKLDLTEGETRLVLEASAGKSVCQEEALTVPMFAMEEPAAQPMPMVDENIVEQTSPLVGTVYLAAEAGAAPYVQVGDQVKKGAPICIVESMKMFNTIEAVCDGKVVEILMDNGQIVEYGQVLVRIHKEG